MAFKPLPRNEQGELDFGVDSDSDEDEAAWAKRLERLEKKRDIAMGLAEEEEGGIPEPAYDVSQLYKKRGFWPQTEEDIKRRLPPEVWRPPSARLATNGYFESLTLLVISFNGIWIGYDTDKNAAAIVNEADTLFQVMENFFCIYFTFEVVVRFMAFRKILRTSKWPSRRGIAARISRFCPFLKDGWFKFDSFLVALMVFETWGITWSYDPNASGGGGGAGNLSLLRLLRLTRMARLMRSMPELMTLIKGMANATR